MDMDNLHMDKDQALAWQVGYTAGVLDEMNDCGFFDGCYAGIEQGFWVIAVKYTEDTPRQEEDESNIRGMARKLAPFAMVRFYGCDGEELAPGDEQS
jgi:hypothetical protein